MSEAVKDNQIIFYCKDCAEVTATEKVGRKFVYKCKKCGTKNVAFGTKKSIFGFFRLDDKEEKRKDMKGEDAKVHTGAKI